MVPRWTAWGGEYLGQHRNSDAVDKLKPRPEVWTLFLGADPIPFRRCKLIQCNLNHLQVQLVFYRNDLDRNILKRGASSLHFPQGRFAETMAELPRTGTCIDVIVSLAPLPSNIWYICF